MLFYLMYGGFGLVPAGSRLGYISIFGFGLDRVGSVICWIEWT